MRKTVIAVLFFFVSSHCFPQLNLKGKIINESDNKPVPYAFVGIKDKKAGGVTDSSGNFQISLPGFIKKNDTVIISSIGFESVKMAVNTAISQSEFKLKAFSKSLEMVTVKSYLNENAIGMNTESFEFFRGWYDVTTGGEIGRIFEVPQQEYKIERIRFKTDNKCDTCLIRLHIRNVIGGLPGEEILKDNIIIPIVNLADNGKSSVFDLEPYNIILTEKEIYIGFEVLNCSNQVSADKSLCFIGTSYGQYFYKSFVNSPWQADNTYNIDVRLYLKY